MAQYFTNFDEYPVGDVTTSGQTDWTPRISNGGSDYRIIDGGDADGKFLRITTSGGNQGSRVLGFNPLNGVSDNLETLVKFWVFKSGNDGSTGRWGAAYTRYGGNSEASTIGYAASFVPVSNVKSLALYEDSTGIAQYVNYPWSTSTDYFIRTRISGNNRYVKIWPASGAEPSTWTMQSTATPPTIASPYSGVGTFLADSYLYVKQYSAGTDGDPAPINPHYNLSVQNASHETTSTNVIVNGTPTSTPQFGYGAAFGGVAAYGAGYARVTQTSATLIELEINNASHQQAVTSPAMTQQHSLVIASASHTHTVDGIVVTQNHNLVTQNTLHALTSKSPLLSHGLGIIVRSATHATKSDNITLVQAQTVVIQNTSHATKSDAVVLAQLHNLLVANTLHATKSDNLDVIYSTLLGVPDATFHSLKTDNIPIIQDFILGMSDDFIRLRSDEARVINWDDLGLFFGGYKPDAGSHGELQAATIDDGGNYKPRPNSYGVLTSNDIADNGIYKPKNKENGTYKG